MNDEMVQVFSEEEKKAVRDGIVAGEVYADGEVWADKTELVRWHFGPST